jgi:hypothetical protein
MVVQLCLCSFCMSADGFRNIWLPFVEKIENNVSVCSFEKNLLNLKMLQVTSSGSLFRLSGIRL